jgi:hypothetical protein
VAVDRRLDPLLRVGKDSLPSDWCLPSFYPIVKDWEARFGFGRTGGPLIVRSGCAVIDDCTERGAGCIAKAVNCSPEAMRADAEAKMRGLGADIWDAAKPLSLDTYALARNLMSEFGSGSPVEKVAVAMVAMNRATALDGSRPFTQGWISGHLLDRKNGLFGRQIGQLRPAATTSDPSVADVLVADYVLRAMQSGEMTDVTWGATHYLDRFSQDGMRARALQNGDSTPPAGGSDVFGSWSDGGDVLTWVGQIPDVRPWRLLLMRRRPELRRDPKARAAIRAAGLDAIKGKNRPPALTRVCFNPGALARATMASSVGVVGFAIANSLTKLSRIR